MRSVVFNVGEPETIGGENFLDVTLATFGESRANKLSENRLGKGWAVLGLLTDVAAVDFDDSA